jgi:hypothetical protein
MEAKALEKDPEMLMQNALKLKQANQWEALIKLADVFPAQLEGAWLRLADEVAFAFGHLGMTEEAAALYTATFSVEPTHRRASALAYVYYIALMQNSSRNGKANNRRNGKTNNRRNGKTNNERHGKPNKGHDKPKAESSAGGGNHAGVGNQVRDESTGKVRDNEKGNARRDQEDKREAFRRWIGEALQRKPDSVKDLYRLGVYEAQIQSRHDVQASRIFRKAISTYRGLKQAARDKRHDLFKPYVRSLYGAARSAFRLQRFEEAKHWIFTCLREDEQTNHVAPLFKLFMAGKVCAALDMRADAERAFRLALDAEGPKRRSYVFSALAKLALRDDRPNDAAAWIEQNIKSHRRSAAEWRLLGDIERKLADDDAARSAYENALKKDFVGRHLTLVRLGNLHLEAKRPGKARRCFERANKFRKRKYLSQDLDALNGLLQVADIQGDVEKAAELKGRIADLHRSRTKRKATAP